MHICRLPFSMSASGERSNIVPGNHYMFEGIEWVCVEKTKEYVTLQSLGICAGAWPGWVYNTPEDEKAEHLPFVGNFDGTDISTLYKAVGDVYAGIKHTEWTTPKYGAGLYLLDADKCGDSKVYEDGMSDGSGAYFDILKEVSDNFSSFGAKTDYVWTGSYIDPQPTPPEPEEGEDPIIPDHVDFDVDRCTAVSNGVGKLVHTVTQGLKGVIAPVFNIDPTKVKVDGENLHYVDIPAIQLNVGEIYTFEGYDWMCAESPKGYYVLQSIGVCKGQWPGYVFNKNKFFEDNFDGKDISEFYQKTMELYSRIESVEYTAAKYGYGLYLVNRNMLNVGSTGYADPSVTYSNALAEASKNYEKFGMLYETGVWLGDRNKATTEHTSYVINKLREVTDANNAWAYPYQEHENLIAPAFNLDPYKVKLNDHDIIIRRYS